MNNKKKDIVVLYSGGVDSTCAAALLLQEFKRIHLITYKRFGIFCISNIERNVSLLRSKFGSKRIIRGIIDIDRFFKKISYENYFYYFKKYGFMMLSTCGLCKLSMHVRTIKYCIDNNISYVADGANKNSGTGHFPAQMPLIINEIRKLYKDNKIVYLTPVLDFDRISASEMDWIRKIGFENNNLNKKDKGEGDSKKTTRDELLRLNIFPESFTKGSKMDRQMQARCFQLILFNIFLYDYFLPVYGEEKYKKITLEFFREKITYCKSLARGSNSSRLTAVKDDLK